MKNRVIRVTVGLLLILFCGRPAAVSGEQAEKGPAVRVRLSVVADERIRGVISSYMAAELRRLGDVAVTDRDPDWHLAVTAIELKRADGSVTGVAISTVIMAPVGEEVKRAILRAVEKDGALPAALQKLKPEQLAVIKSNWLRADADTALRGLCLGIIADFDTQYLQPERERNQP